MSRAILVSVFAAISFGFASQAFGHAGTKEDPLPQSQFKYGRPQLGPCPAGFTALYVRTSIANAPKNPGALPLVSMCFRNDSLADRRAALYDYETAPAPAPKVTTPTPQARPTIAPKVATPTPQATPTAAPKVATPTPQATPTAAPKVTTPSPSTTPSAPSAVYEQAKLARPGSFVNCQGDQNCLTVARQACSHFNGRPHFQRQLGNGFRDAADQSVAVAMRCEKKG